MNTRGSSTKIVNLQEQLRCWGPLRVQDSGLTVLVLRGGVGGWRSACVLFLALSRSVTESLPDWLSHLTLGLYGVKNSGVNIRLETYLRVYLQFQVADQPTPSPSRIHLWTKSRALHLLG